MGNPAARASIYDLFALSGYHHAIRHKYTSVTSSTQCMRRLGFDMTAMSTNTSTNIADACVVDLHTYRLATFGRRHDGRTLTVEAEDLATAINRLLDRVGACLAAVTPARVRARD